MKVENGKSSELFSSESTWSAGLALSIVNSGDYGLLEAITISSTACERCLNVLIDKYGGYGDDKGYKEHSEKWEKCGTACHFCVEEETDGYVSYEKKYIVDIGSIAFLAKFLETDVDIYDESVKDDDKYNLHLTEKEIKDYDEKYWAFRKEVE